MSVVLSYTFQFSLDFLVKVLLVLEWGREAQRVGQMFWPLACSQWAPHLYFDMTELDRIFLLQPFSFPAILKIMYKGRINETFCLQSKVGLGPQNMKVKRRGRAAPCFRIKPHGGSALWSRLLPLYMPWACGQQASEKKRCWPLVSRGCQLLREVEPTTLGGGLLWAGPDARRRGLRWIRHGVRIEECPV